MSPVNYRFKCGYRGCPCNDKGVCMTMYVEFPVGLLHDFDGYNYIKCLCG